MEKIDFESLRQFDSMTPEEAERLTKLKVFKAEFYAKYEKQIAWMSQLKELKLVEPSEITPDDRQSYEMMVKANEENKIPWKTPQERAEFEERQACFSGFNHLQQELTWYGLLMDRERINNEKIMLETFKVILEAFKVTHAHMSDDEEVKSCIAKAKVDIEAFRNNITLSELNLAARLRSGN